MLSRNEKGYTLLELLITITIIGILSTALTSFAVSSLRKYLGLQKDATAFSEISQQSQRITNVLRGSTDITSASDYSVTVYAYFFPNNQYVSEIKYYLNVSNTTLYADVTPMSANPPNGTLLTAQKKTYTVVPYFYQASGTKLFEYLDATSNPISTPIADLKTIKGIRVNLKTPVDGLQANNFNTISTQISLRNRKTNL